MLAALTPVRAGGVAARASAESVADPAANKQTEYRVKAAAVYHFLRYTTWPDESFENDKAPLVVTVIGDSKLYDTLAAALADKRIEGRAVSLSRAPSVPERVTSHFVLAGELEPLEHEQLIARATGRPCFLFADIPGYARAGACGNFLIEKGKVRFELNKEVLKASGLEVSSQLMKLAKIVETEKKRTEGK